MSSLSGILVRPSVGAFIGTSGLILAVCDYLGLIPASIDTPVPVWLVAGVSLGALIAHYMAIREGAKA